MTDETYEKLLAQADLKRRRAVAAAEEEYQRAVEAVRVLRELFGGASKRLAHGTLSSVILEAVEQLDGPFTVRDIEERLQDLAPEVAERASTASISTTLRRLVGRRLDLAEPGSATRPSKYRKAS